MKILSFTIVFLFAVFRLIFPLPVHAQTLPYKDIKSVTYRTSISTTYSELRDTIPFIKATGFNTVWLVNIWRDYNPQPLASPPVYNETAFNELKKTLTLLRDNNMQAILPLNYVGGGRGWAPEGIDCNWITDPVQYSAFETYVREFLTRILDFHSEVYILFFTEGALDKPQCALPYSYQEQAVLLQSTLGSLPNRLPQNLRSQFLIGYHDGSLIGQGLSLPDSPITSPNPFDFVSMIAYGLESFSNTQIENELDFQAARFKNLYPSTPLIIGEFGADSCNNQEDNQARVVTTIASWALNKGYGFNLWGWKPGPADQECTNPSYSGLAITNQDGSPKPVVSLLKTILSPKIESGGVNKNYQPWAVWLQGKNLSPFLKAQLFDGGNRWGSDLPVTLSEDHSWLSFQLPSNSPPSECNSTNACSIAVRLLDTRSGLSSDFFFLSLPANNLLSGDLNSDGHVDILDLRQFLPDFGKSSGMLTVFFPGDINQDTFVNIFDYNILVGNFGRTQ